VWFAWGAENDEIEVPKKSAETGGHQFGHMVIVLTVFSFPRHFLQIIVKFVKFMQ
jgi:hypothetical protein